MDPPTQPDAREPWIGGEGRARLGGERDRRGHPPFPGAAEAPGREHAVVAPWRFGEDLAVELGRAGVARLLTASGRPVERRVSVAPGGPELGEAGPGRLSAMRCTTATQHANPPP